MPFYLCNLLGEAVSTTLQNFDDLLMMGRIFSKTNLQLPEELAAFFKGLLLFKLTKKKNIHPSCSRTHLQVSLVELNKLKNACLATCFPSVLTPIAELGRETRL